MFSFVFYFLFPVFFSRLCRVDNQAHTYCVSSMPSWVRCNLYCLISTHLSNMKFILRSPNSPWSLSQV